MWGTKRYEYLSGNLELDTRVQGGEPLRSVLDEILLQWKPGNESLWDDYDAESLIDTEEKRREGVNQLLYSRLTIYRALWEAGKDIRGEDPFLFVDEVPELLQSLRERFPNSLPVIDYERG